MLPPAGDPFYNVIGLAICGMIRRRFEASGQPGASWPPPRSRPGGLPLLASGDLMRRINHLLRPNGSGGTEISVGLTDKRAAILHFGGEIRPVKAKALFLPISAKGRAIGPKPKGERDALRERINLADRLGQKTRGLMKRILIWGVDFLLVGKVTIPARPFLFLAPQQKEELKAVAIYELRKRGFGGN